MGRAANWRPLFQFRLFTLLAVLTVVGPVVYLVYSLTRPYFVYDRIDCGGGRYVALLMRNEFCDVAAPAYYRVSGMPHREAPPSFAMRGCGDSTPMVMRTADGGNIVALASADFDDEILILIDFRQRQAWPPTWSREVDDTARRMLERLRAEHGELWLYRTYDNELTKPFP
jgi:hypothetical protein